MVLIVLCLFNENIIAVPICKKIQYTFAGDNYHIKVIRIPGLVVSLFRGFMHLSCSGVKQATFFLLLCPQLCPQLPLHSGPLGSLLLTVPLFSSLWITCLASSYEGPWTISQRKMRMEKGPRGEPLAPPAPRGSVNPNHRDGIPVRMAVTKEQMTGSAEEQREEDCCHCCWGFKLAAVTMGEGWVYLVSDIYK